ncbi:hypothetical protein GF324_06685, partial [bacterium]|nr:hypothetical protein [bacterium]
MTEPETKPKPAPQTCHHRYGRRRHPFTPQFLLSGFLLGLFFVARVSSGLPGPIPLPDRADPYEDDHTTFIYPPYEHSWGYVRAEQKHLTLFTFGKAEFINPQGL